MHHQSFWPSTKVFLKLNEAFNNSSIFLFLYSLSGKLQTNFISESKHFCAKDILIISFSSSIFLWFLLTFSLKKILYKQSLMQQQSKFLFPLVKVENKRKIWIFWSTWSRLKVLFTFTFYNTQFLHRPKMPPQKKTLLFTFYFLCT